MSQNPNTHLDFDFQGLLDGLQLNDALLLLMHLLDDMLELHLTFW